MDSTSTIQSSESQAGTPIASETRSYEALVNHLYGPVIEPLQRVESLLRSELQSQVESLAPLLRHARQLGGKRLRPALLLLSAKTIAGVTDQHVALAAVIEMIHTATLIHDDVLDEADTRRHLPTVNARWNNHTSILFGDYLFAQSFRLAAANTTSDVCELVGEAARMVCEGELRQILQRDVLSLDEESYIDIVQGKTGELCRVACQLGAICSDADPAIVAALQEYGASLGIAFQIADDYLDLWGDDGEVGKTLGTDLQQGKMTLPLIRLLSTAEGHERAEIVTVLTSPGNGRVDQVRDWLRVSDAREYTVATAQRYSDRAIESLQVLPNTDAKACLEAIARFAIARSF